MAVALRGYTQGSRISGGVTVPWPAGTVAGDVALIHIGGASRAPDLASTDGGGWTPVGHKAWFRVLTSADVALTGPAVTGSHVKLQTFSGAGGVGRTSSQNGLTTTVPGGGVWFDGARPSSGIAPSTYRLGAEWTDGSGWAQAAFFVPAASAGWVALPGVASGVEAYSYEILPLSAPAAPTLVAPLAGATVDEGKPVAFSWQHQSQQPQIGFRLQTFRNSDAWTRYATGSGLWSDDDTVVISGQQSITMTGVPSGDQWRVQTQSAQGWSAWSPWRSWTLREAPTLGPVTVAAPAGDLSPEVSWSVTSSWSDPVAHRVRVTLAGASSPDQGAIYDSGVLSNAVSPDVIPSSTPWTSGAAMRVWLDVWDNYGLTSQASATFTVSWTPPAAPGISAAVGDPPLVTVTGLTVGQPVQVEQRLDGVTWTPLVSTTATATSMAFGSPLAMTGQPVAFRARTSTVVDGVTLWSNWSPIASVVQAPLCGYLVDDTDRSVYLRVHLRSDEERVRIQGITVSVGLGATSARIDSTVEAGQSSTTVFATGDEAERAALMAWLAARAVWWITWPPNRGEPLPSLRVARTSARREQRRHQTILSGEYDVPVSWVEQSGA